MSYNNRNRNNNSGRNRAIGGSTSQRPKNKSANRGRIKSQFNNQPRGQEREMIQRLVNLERMAVAKEKVERRDKKAVTNIKRKEKAVEKEYDGWDALTDVGKFGLKALKTVGTIVGLGDYHIKSNSLLQEMSPGMDLDPIPIENSMGSTIVKHREYLTDILGSTTAFNPTEYVVQPGFTSTFPWLSAIANNYQHYRLRGLYFEFKSLATNYSTNTYIGYVAMATQYNVSENAFTNKVDMCNYEYSTTCRSDESMRHFIECALGARVMDDLFVRDSSSTVLDPKFYDAAIVTVATGGQPNSGIIGELWITYEVELFKPKSGQTQGYDILYDSFSLPTTHTVTANSSLTAPWTRTGPTSMTMIQNSNNQLTFPVYEGSYDFTWFIYGSTTTSVYMNTIPTLTNCTIIGQMLITPSGGTTAVSSSLIINFKLKLTGNAQNPSSITFDSSGTNGYPNNISAGYVTVTQIPDFGTLINKRLLSNEIQLHKSQPKLETMVKDMFLGVVDDDERTLLSGDEAKMYLLMVDMSPKDAREYCFNQKVFKIDAEGSKKVWHIYQEYLQSQMAYAANGC